MSRAFVLDSLRARRYNPTHARDGSRRALDSPGMTRMHRHANAKQWIVPDADPRAAELAQRLRTSSLVAQMLLNRGLADPDDCRGFLRPTLKCLHEPATMPGLLTAAQRVAKAIRDGERIVIYGDYDVDGITGVAILWHAIRLL